MLRMIAIVALSITACDKSAAKPKPAPVPTTAVDGTRVVAIEAASTYKPAEIVAAPGEKLTLAITRTSEGCIQDFRSPDGKVVRLEKDKVTEIKVLAPASGEWNFGCDMEHCHEGKIVVRTP